MDVLGHTDPLYLIKSPCFIRLHKCHPSSRSDPGSLHELRENMPTCERHSWICDPDHEINIIWSAVQNYNFFSTCVMMSKYNYLHVVLMTTNTQFWNPETTAGTQYFLSGTKYSSLLPKKASCFKSWKTKFHDFTKTEKHHQMNPKYQDAS